MQFLKSFLILVILVSATVSTEAQFRVRVKFNEIPNLTYQLDCVSDLQINCSRQNLGELWNRQFLKTDEDRKMLKEWARLREFYSQNIQLSKNSDADSVYLEIFDKIRIAGFQSESTEDYMTRLDLLTLPADRTDYEKVIRHFLPGFRQWWQTEAEKSGGEFARQTEALLHSAQISTQIKQFYDFYAPDLPDNYEITFNLFYVPDFVNESTNGQQLQNYSLAEFKPGEKPEQRIDVVIHELTHFFYESISAENTAKLARNFYDLKRASAIPSYNLLNEALSTAFGNGMIARSVTPKSEFENYLVTKQSFYNNESIDRAAKAALPWLDEWIKNKRTIHDPQFASEYISVLEKNFGEDLLAPKLNLSEMFLFADTKYGGSLRRDARQILGTASFYASEGDWNKEDFLEAYNNRPRINSLLIIHPDNIKDLGRNKIISVAQAAEIQNEFNKTGRVLYNAERAPFNYVYIAVAKDSETIKQLIGKLAQARQFQGIYKN